MAWHINCPLLAVVFRLLANDHLFNIRRSNIFNLGSF
jgi:hypothetical protein